MAIQADSRYIGLALKRAAGPSGEPRLTLELRLQRPRADAPVTRHRVVQGELIDALAARYLGDERLWWRILDANPAVYPLDLSPGDVIAIPAPAGATRAVRARRF
jgi:hypothetical protein